MIGPCDIAFFHVVIVRQPCHPSTATLLHNVAMCNVLLLYKPSQLPPTIPNVASTDQSKV